MRARRRLQHPGRESRHRKVSDEALLRLLSRDDKKGGLPLARLWRSWEEVVGPEVAELARPLGHREGALVLCAQDSVAAQQLSYYAPELLERVNAFFGKEVFDKVRFELLDGRVPLGLHNSVEAPPPARRPQKPCNLVGLVGKIDPEIAVGRCYAAYVRYFEGLPGDTAPEVANTRPQGASRRRK
jgi:hypothetical protein